ncbi:WecB/TagA/CpsF family glycosyltransferase [Caldimonas sp.]|uniref:WecB/TagA/CpsF family glycosyltransferase n=1 Tax=Caldimonas sp. TaxID=2838790 RepID=UPI00307E3BC2
MPGEVSALSTPARAPVIDLDRRVVCLWGLPFDVIDLPGAVQALREAARSGRRCWVSTPNLNFVIAARKDAAFRRSVLMSQLSLADGMPLVWAARLLGLPLRQRVAGSDLFEALSREDAAAPLKVYFFGGPEGAAQAACERLNARAGGLRCVGFESPGFGSLESMSTPQTWARINASGADFVVVALGAQKGQAWIAHNHPQLHAPLISHLGAVVNFQAGTVRRAPAAWRHLGLEWLWRILQEPALWKRYARDAAAALPLLTGCLLPLWWARRRWRGCPALDVRVEPVAEEGGQRVRLAGVACGLTIEPLRQAFKQALHRPQPLEIELSGLRDLDPQAMGLLLLVQAHQLLSGQPLRVRGATPALRRRILQHGCAHWLDAEEPPS